MTRTFLTLAARLSAALLLVVFLGLSVGRALPRGPQLTYTAVPPVGGSQQTQMKLLDVQRQLIHTFNLPPGNFYPAWSPDGRYLAYFHRLPQNFDIVQLNVLDTVTNVRHTLVEERLLAQTNIQQPPVWNAEGTALAYVLNRIERPDAPETDNVLAVVLFPAGPPRTLAISYPGRFLVAEGLQWLPAGSALLYSTDDLSESTHHLYHTDATTGTTRPLWPGYLPRLSPDGNRLMYWNSTRIHILPFEVPPLPLSTPPPAQLELPSYADSPAWADDDDLFFYRRYSQSIDRAFTGLVHYHLSAATLRNVPLPPLLDTSPVYSTDGFAALYLLDTTTYVQTLHVYNVRTGRKWPIPLIAIQPADVNYGMSWRP